MFCHTLDKYVTCLGFKKTSYQAKLPRLRSWYSEGAVPYFKVKDNQEGVNTSKDYKMYIYFSFAVAQIRLGFILFFRSPYILAKAHFDNVHLRLLAVLV